MWFAHNRMCVEEFNPNLSSLPLLFSLSSHLFSSLSSPISSLFLSPSSILPLFFSSLLSLLYHPSSPCSLLSSLSFLSLFFSLFSPLSSYFSLLTSLSSLLVSLSYLLSFPFSFLYSLSFLFSPCSFISPLPALSSLLTSLSSLLYSLFSPLSFLSLLFPLSSLLVSLSFPVSSLSLSLSSPLTSLSPLFFLSSLLSPSLSFTRFTDLVCTFFKLLQVACKYLLKKKRKKNMRKGILWPCVLCLVRFSGTYWTHYFWHVGANDIKCVFPSEEHVGWHGSARPFTWACLSISPLTPFHSLPFFFRISVSADHSWTTSTPKRGQFGELFTV